MASTRSASIIRIVAKPKCLAQSTLMDQLDGTGGREGGRCGVSPCTKSEADGERTMSTKRKCAFTLIELLVVVAIIALLISILLPSLATAKRQARRVVCGSNLHQLGLGIAEYADDNKGWYPSVGKPGTGQTWDTLDDEGNPIYYNMVWEWGGDQGHGWANRPAEKRVMFRYIYPEFFQCPDDRPAEFVGDGVGTSFYWTGTSYPLNGYNWSTFATVFPKSYGRLGILNRTATEVTNPNCVLTGEVVMDEFFSDCDSWPPPPKPPRGAGYRWHDLKKPMANLVFFDGHTDYVLINPTEKRVQIPSYWWWEGKGYTYSYCPTAPSKRYESPWYVRNH